MSITTGSYTSKTVILLCLNYYFEYLRAVLSFKLTLWGILMLYLKSSTYNKYYRFTASFPAVSEIRLEEGITVLSIFNEKPMFLLFQQGIKIRNSKPVSSPYIILEDYSKRLIFNWPTQFFPDILHPP